MDGDEYESITEDQMRAFAGRQEWIYAKTMPKTPHEYVLKWKAANAQQWFQFVMTIRRFGYDQKYNTMMIRYYDLGEHKYWTMGEFLETTWVLNRARIYRPPHPRLLSGVEFKPKKGRPRWDWAKMP